MRKSISLSSSMPSIPRWKNYLINCFKVFCMTLSMFISTNTLSQVLPDTSACTSKDLELVSATLPPNLGEDPCSCSGERTLYLSIKNKTGSERTSFAFWGILERYDPAGVLLSSTPITGCNGPILKNTPGNSFTITTLPYGVVTLQCDQTLKIKNLFLAWTTSNNKETCPLNSATISPKCGTVPEFQILAGVDANFDVVSATCSGGTSSITTTVFGGLAPYTYSWTASNGGTVPPGQSTSKDLTNLTPGTYSLLITDANECTATRSRVITNPSALTLGTCSKTDVACFGGSNGSISAGTVGNAIGTVNYSWKNAANTVVGTTPNVGSLPAGAYTLTVSDDCSSLSCTVTIGGPAASLSLGTCSKTDVSCFGGSNGSVSAGAVSNNVGTANYSWKNASNAEVGTTPNVNNLPAGAYTLTVTDNCSNLSCTVTIGGPTAALSLGTCSKTDVTCFGGSNGSVSAGAVSNNVGTANYSWKNASNVEVGTTANVNNLPAGAYTLTVTDNCSSQTCTVTIGGPTAALSLGTCSKTDVTCFGGTNGSVSAGLVSNNVGTANYSWKNASNTEVGITPNVSSLPAGVYTITVTDNCSSQSCTVTISGPTVGLALGTCSKTDATCTTGGSVSAGTVSNNVGTIYYSWKNAADVEVGTTPNVGDLPAGTYTLTVSDDCSTRSCSVSISGPQSIGAPTVCIVQPSLCGSAGSVTVTSPAMGPDVSYSINNGTAWQASNVFNNLGAGSVSGIKVKIGDCISPAASCDASSCDNFNSPTIVTNISEKQASEKAATNPSDGKVINPATTEISTGRIETINARIGSNTKVLTAPNPFNDKIRFSLQSAVSGYGTLELFNMLGQKVSVVFQGYVEAGKFRNIEYTVNHSQRTDLMYVFTVGDQKTTGKLLGIK